MQTFPFVFVLLCLSEPYVHAVCCYTEVCSAESNVQVSDLLLILSSFLYCICLSNSLKYYQKRNQKRFEFWHIYIHSRLGCQFVAYESFILQTWVTNQQDACENEQ